MARWVKLFDSILESELWMEKDHTRIVGIYLFMIANHKKKGFQGQIVDRGQTFRTQRTIGDACNYSRQTVRTALNRLVEIEFISLYYPKGNHSQALITVTAYNKYQGGEQPLTNHSPEKELAHKISAYLLTTIAKATGRKLTGTPAAGAGSILRLLKVASKEEIKKTIDWLAGPNQTAEYSFVVQSGKSLFEKWDKIQTAMNRQPKKRKEIQL